jgi:serine/threonine protein kinase
VSELAALRSEVGILTRLSHPHIVRLLDYFETASEIVLVTELACGELFEVLCSDGRLAPAAVASVASGLTSALAYLHEQRVMHRDLKPQNCLITATGVVKLTDFGFAKELHSHTAQLTSVRGTPLYMAPELFQQAQYTAAADVWSLGVLLFELAAGRPPFFADTLPELMQAIVQSTPVAFPQDMQPQLADFLALCLQRDPGQRASWEVLLQHPYLTG